MYGEKSFSPWASYGPISEFAYFDGGHFENHDILFMASTFNGRGGLNIKNVPDSHDIGY